MLLVHARPPSSPLPSMAGSGAGRGRAVEEWKSFAPQQWGATSSERPDTEEKPEKPAPTSASPPQNMPGALSDLAEDGRKAREGKKRRADNRRANEVFNKKVVQACRRAPINPRGGHQDGEPRVLTQIPFKMLDYRHGSMRVAARAGGPRAAAGRSTALVPSSASMAGVTALRW